VNFGDRLSGPLEPKKTFDLRAKQHIIASVCGNEDRAIAGRQSPYGESGIGAFARADLPGAARVWLASLPRKRLLFGNILLCHNIRSA
jgi:hypothetical protein